LLTTGGSSASQLPAFAVSSRLASTPSCAHSWIPGPLTCAAVGGLPDTTRDLSTVIAVSPPPPATAKSFHLSPLLSRIFFNSATDLASPPEVHQCSTSTSPAAAGLANAMPNARAKADHPIPRKRLHIVSSPSRLLLACSLAPSQPEPVGSAAAHLLFHQIRLRGL